MESKWVNFFKKLLESNQIPYMEIFSSLEENIDIEIKLYFPKIIETLCQLINEKYALQEKEKIVINRDSEGYHKVTISMFIAEERVTLELKSMLKDTWGIANNQ